MLPGFDAEHIIEYKIFGLINISFNTEYIVFGADTKRRAHIGLSLIERSNSKTYLDRLVFIFFHLLDNFTEIYQI